MVVVASGIRLSELHLTQGLTTFVDECVYEGLSRWRWQAQRKVDGRYYAVRTESVADGNRQLKLHNEVLRLFHCPRSLTTDHKDGNGLHNWIDNLRPASRSQNMHNRKMSKNNTSGFKGVVWHSRDNAWQAQIKSNGKRIYLGYFDSPTEAALAYDAAAAKLHGVFARPNFPVKEVVH